MNDYFYLQILKYALECKDKVLMGYAISRIENTLFSRQSELLALAERGENAQLASLVEDLLVGAKGEGQGLQGELARHLSEGIDADDEELFFEDKFTFMMRILRRQDEFFYRLKTPKQSLFETNDLKNLSENSRENLEQNLEKNSQNLQDLNGENLQNFERNLGENLGENSRNLEQNSAQNSQQNFEQNSRNFESNSQENSQNFQAKSNEISIFVDEEFEALKREYLGLSELYASELERKESILALYDAFNTAYYGHFGELLGEILALQKRLAKAAIKNAKSAEERAQKQKIYDDIFAQEEQLKAHKNAPVPKFELDEAGESELKSLFRKAVKLCHPDMIGSADKLKHYHKVVQAHKDKDLQGLRELLWELESALANAFEDFEGDGAQTDEQKKRLKAMIAGLKERLKCLKIELGELENSAKYEIVSNKQDWEAFFAREKMQLENERDRLKSEVAGLGVG